MDTPLPFTMESGLICSKFSPADSLPKFAILFFKISICKFPIWYSISLPMLRSFYFLKQKVQGWLFGKFSSSEETNKGMQQVIIICGVLDIFILPNL